MNTLFLSPLNVGFSALLLVLAVASTVTAGLIRLRPGKSFVELKLRVQTWWWLAGLLLVALSVERGIALAIFAAVTFVAFKEYLSIAATRRADHTALLLAYLLIPLQYLWAGMAWYGLFITFIPLCVLLVVPALLVLSGETNGFLRAAGAIQWGLMTIVFGLSHVAYLLKLPPATAGGTSGEMLVFYLLVLTQLNDVAQYLWGKACGRHKVAPTVSPGKTVEGLLGGIATTTLLAWMFAPYLTPMHGLPAIASGLLIGVAGFVGDLVVSAVKRDLGVKDTGTLLPGHGGMLDRLDSLTLTAPLFFHFVHYLYY
jgi:phosphatidate cytidylyltransferase